MNDGALLLAARTDADIVAICERIASSSPHVVLAPRKLASFDGIAAAARPCAWDWIVREGCASIEEAWDDIVLNAALNGGFFAVSPCGAVRQWQERGSGSTALCSWIDRLREDGLVPGVDVHAPDEARRRLAPRVDGLPHAAWRLDVLAGFADAERRTAMQDLLAQTGVGGPHCRFTVADADRLAQIHPEAFAADPFRKKALLAFLLMAGRLSAIGLPCAWDAPCPADYQLPRYLAAEGALELSQPFLEALRDERRLLDVTSDPVVHLRAATVVYMRRIAQRTGQPDWIVDGALFRHYRGNPCLLADAPPPMRCDSPFF